MNLNFYFSRQLRWFNVPGALLFALFQRSPAVQVATTAAEFVAASPVGNVLRSAAVAAASLGAIHSMAGATQFVISRTSVAGTVGTPISAIGFTVNNAQVPPGSFRITDLPPGITVAGADSSGLLNRSSGVISGTPTTPGTFTTSIVAFQFSGGVGDSFGPATITFTISGAAATAPSITTQPVSQTVNLGATVTFTAAASGSPSPAFQWTRNSTAIAGATSAALTLPSAQAGDAGSYAVTATNSAGTVMSNAATLTVNTPLTSPTFTMQPAAQSTIALGSTVAFSVAAPNAASFQWKFNGATLTGATNAMLVIPNLIAAQAGVYTCVATNGSGSTPSDPATLTLVATSDPGRLTNLSVLTDITAAVPSFTVGTVIGGVGTSGTKSLVVRAVGPSLGALGVPGTIGDPKLDLFSGQTVIASNDNWGSDTTAVATLTNAMASVGAFAFTGPTSKDAAVFQRNLSGGYTVQVSGANGATGTAIAEIYDATAAGTFTPSSPRLINVSVLKTIPSGGLLTLGFTVGGSVAKTVLIRVIGPGLAAVGVTNGTLGDPQVTLFNSSSTVIATNDDWGADPQLSAAGARVNAFSIGNTASKDAMLIVTLPPGGYTAQARGNSGTSGLAIVEVYELP